MIFVIPWLQNSGPETSFCGVFWWVALLSGGCTLQSLGSYCMHIPKFHADYLSTTCHMAWVMLIPKFLEQLLACCTVAIFGNARSEVWISGSSPCLAKYLDQLVYYSYHCTSL